MKRIGYILVLLLMLSTASAGAFEFMAPRGTGMGRTVSLSLASATSQLNLRSRGLKAGGWQLESGYNRRFELADLDHIYLAAATRWRRWTVAVGASQFGRTDLYAEQLLKGSVSFQYDSLSVGASISAMQVEFGNGYGRLRAVTAGLGVSYRWRRILAAVTVDRMTSPKLTDYSENIPPTYSLHTELLGKNGAYSVTGRVTVEEFQKPQFALGQIIRLSHRGSFFWGVSSAPLEFGGGLEIYVASGSVIYASSVHPDLGFTQTVSFTYGSGHKEPESGDDFK